MEKKPIINNPIFYRAASDVSYSLAVAVGCVSNNEELIKLATSLDLELRRIVKLNGNDNASTKQD